MKRQENILLKVFQVASIQEKNSWKLKNMTEEMKKKSIRGRWLEDKIEEIFPESTPKR